MLKTPLIINGWLVQATLKFLSMESPNLCDYLAPTRSNPPVKSVYRDDRQSLLASYELIISHGEAFAIYSSLEISRQKFGNNRAFEGMHLHTMAELWRDYVDKLENAPVEQRMAN